MLTVPIGPLALPVGPLLLLGAWGVAALVARATMPRRAAGAEGVADAADAREFVSATLSRALWVGVLGARLVHVGWHAGAYAAQPAALLDVRDGGFSLLGGLAAALAVVGWRARARPALARPLGAAALAAALAWGAGQWAFAPSRGPSLPTVAVHAMQAPGAAAGAAPTVPTTAAAVARGRPVVLNLWATWCPPCREEMPMLAAAQRAHPQVAFVFANQGEDAPTVARYLEGAGLPTLADVVLDPPRALGVAVGSRGLPTTLFYAADGRLVDAHVGVLSAPALEVKLAALRRDAR